MNSTVSIKKINNKADDLRIEVIEAVSCAMDLAEWTKYIKQGEDVALKPNLCADIFYPGYTTSPWFLEAVILKLQSFVGKIYVIESDTYTTDVEQGVRQSGLMKIIEKYPNVKWINLSKSQYVKISLPNNLALGKKVEIPQILSRAKLITLPVLKTHGLSGVTGAIKNQWGCLKKIRLDYHEVLADALVDVNRLIKPTFCIMDGTVGADGKGPKQGNPREGNIILASNDNVALDTIATLLMGLKPTDIKHIVSCAKYNTGNMDLSKINVVGNSDWKKINLHYTKPQQSLLTFVDIQLRRPFLKRFFYQTPVFKLVIMIAKLNYPLWMLFIGKPRRKRFLRKSRYANQWSSKN